MSATHLSPRMAQCVRLRSQGLSNREIAADMHISQGTVKVYLSRAAAQTGLPIGKLAASVAQNKGVELLRTHALALREWKHNYGDQLPAEAGRQFDSVLWDMVRDALELPDLPVLTNH